jgi:hypothetical protein
LLTATDLRNYGDWGDEDQYILKLEDTVTGDITSVAVRKPGGGTGAG